MRWGKKMSFKHVKDILPSVLEGFKKEDFFKVKKVFANVVGEKIFKMLKITSFEKGILVVSIENSTLYSLIKRYGKTNILKRMQKKFSKEIIKNIIYKIG